MSIEEVLMLSIENLPQAIADCTKAIELDPKFAAAYFNRGCDYHTQKI